MIKKTYSFTKDGKQNDVYTLKNAQGVEVDILTYGAFYAFLYPIERVNFQT